MIPLAAYLATGLLLALLAWRYGWGLALQEEEQSPWEYHWLPPRTGWHLLAIACFWPAKLLWMVIAWGSATLRRSTRFLSQPLPPLLHRSQEAEEGALPELDPGRRPREDEIVSRWGRPREGEGT